MLSATARADTRGAVAAEAKQGVNVLLRGPVHEAFAAPVVGSTKHAGAIAKKPPELIKEMPPKIRPTGSNIAWIPGYWAWDDTARDFIWISGLWRDVPPGRRWMPGYWASADNGWRWYSGAWIRGDAQTLSYQPMPQASLEQGPTSEPESDDQQWVPGSWVYQDQEYQWRPGFWASAAPGWCWMPDYYIDTPRGAVFVEGYWDYGLEARGTLFAPAAVARAALDAGVEYTPSQVLDATNLMLHLFARTDHHHYYFGDYYGDSFANMGIRPWYEFRTRETGIDPLLTHYIRENKRQGVDLVHELTGWHDYFLRHAALRPPHVLSDVAAFVDRNKTMEYVQRAVLGQTLEHLASAPDRATQFVRVTAQELQGVTGAIGSLSNLASLRMSTEIAASGSGLVGNALGGSVTAGARTHTVLKLPAIDQPLMAAPASGIAPALDIVPGVQRGEGVLPTVPNVQRVLPAVPPVVPLVPRKGLF